LAKKIGVIGLGYVGLEIGKRFAKKNKVIGYDIDDAKMLKASKFFRCSVDLSDCHVFIICVPTPTNTANRPDLGAVIAATNFVNQFTKPGDLLVYESTFYPGCLRRVLMPKIQGVNSLHVAYSPERINPGDKTNTLKTIAKLVAGVCDIDRQLACNLYSEICDLVVPVDSIEIAEAAKCLENAQRDVNIAFMNEMAILFDRLGLKSKKVFDAAKTKWNYIDFRPGLVGGHCIGVDSDYLLSTAIDAQSGTTAVLRSARQTNELMTTLIGEKCLGYRRILIVGSGFKANSTDERNSGGIKIYNWLNRRRDKFDHKVFLTDPLIPEKRYRVHPLDIFDCIVFAIDHDQVKQNLDFYLMSLSSFDDRKRPLVVDVKSIVGDECFVNDRDFDLWQL